MKPFQYTIRADNRGTGQLPAHWFCYPDEASSTSAWLQLIQQSGIWYPHSFQLQLYEGDRLLNTAQCGYIDLFLHRERMGLSFTPQAAGTELSLYVVHADLQGEYYRFVSLDRPPLSILACHEVDQVRIRLEADGWHFAPGSAEVHPIESLLIEAKHTVRIIEW
ncbi:hypothetical protein [Paenibacillus bovis]|uniref:Uncharacterized protein n=1 Tax=Paenibacillus bovis TaxID=1616788 RepID=A0A1X9T3X0_9BACL|nr:hypothetical protein [Paenibacillus bovis]ARR10657.1 hypothetical protein AR543_p0049 [Paenibacillus bovis]